MQLFPEPTFLDRSRSLIYTPCGHHSTLLTAACIFFNDFIHLAVSSFWEMLQHCVIQLTRHSQFSLTSGLDCANKGSLYSILAAFHITSQLPTVVYAEVEQQRYNHLGVTLIHLHL